MRRPATVVGGHQMGNAGCMVVGTTYYGLTGLLPQAYRYLPQQKKGSDRRTRGIICR